jgi:energy-coupling factor transport system substrate-specific component
VWDVLFIIPLILRRKELSSTFWAIISGFFGLSFGTLCSIPYFFMGGFPSWFAYWIANMPFDITHAVSNFLIALFLFAPLLKLLKLIKNRYDFSA